MAGMSWCQQDHVQDTQSSALPKRKLRLACDHCHYAKVKCTGGNPCYSCYAAQTPCVRSQSNRVGRPKGTKNRKTLEMLENIRVNAEASTSTKTSKEDSRAPSTSSGDGNVDRTAAQPEHLTTLAESSTNHTTIFPPQQSKHRDLLSNPLPKRFRQRPSNSPVDHNYRNGNEHIASTTDYSDLFSSATMSAANTDVNADFAMIFPEDLMADVVHLDAGLASGHSVPSHAACHSADDVLSFADMKFDSSIAERPFTGRHSISDTTSHARSRSHELEGSLAFLTQSATAPATPESLSDSSSHCRCLQNHAQFLCNLRELGRGPVTPPIDAVLDCINRGYELWGEFAQCRICQRDSDQEQETLLLSAMSIRAVLRLLECISTDQAFGYTDITAIHDPPSFDHPSAIHPPVTVPGSTRLTLGSLEITGEDRLLVVRLLVSKTLIKIQHMLARFKHRSCQTTARPSPVLAAGNMITSNADERSLNPGHGNTHVHSILHRLEQTIHGLSQTLQPLAASSSSDVFADDGSGNHLDFAI